MLSDEEIKAIERLNIYKEKIKNELDPTIDFEEEKALGVVLNLIEKQSKEIEELKEKIKNFTIEDEKIFLQFGEIIEKKRWKNKIKAKIEEIKDGTYDAKIILQKLLEE